MNQPNMRPAAIAAQAITQEQNGEFGRLLQKSFTPLDLLQDQNFDKIWRMADALSNSALSIPKELKGNIGDCLAIVTQAMIWGLNPFAVAQKAHVINGKLGYEAQLVNAVVMQSGAIIGSFCYEHQGDSCRVGAVLRGASAITWGEWLSAGTVTTRNSPLWKTNPKQQMGYLQVKNWARAYCPGALLGIYSTDELEAMPDAMTPAQSVEVIARAPAMPDYSLQAFETNLPRWAQLVADGKKSAADLLAMLSTKAAFSPEQRAAILALQPTPAPAPPADSGHQDFVDEMDAAEGAQ